MIRAQRVAGGKKIDLLVAAMPEGEDPADMLAAGEIERFRELVEGAIDLWTFRVRTILARADVDTPTGRERALGEAASVLKAMGDAVGRDELVREVGDRLDLPPTLVIERIRTAPDEPAAEPARASGGGEAPGPAKVERIPPTPRESRERALLAMCIADPKNGRGFIDKLTDEQMSRSGRSALVWLREHLEEPLAGLPRGDAELVSLITELKMQADRDPTSPGAMRLNYLLLEQFRLEGEIAAARRTGDMQAVARLGAELSELAGRISHDESVGA
jgi:DNA primase